MTAYVKSTNFASKDSLASGNPLKIVKGTEIDTEFNNIALSIGTKADLASPTFTGVPAAPTAAAGTSTSQLATTAFVTGSVNTAVAPKANSESPTFTGVPTAPTPLLSAEGTTVATVAAIQALYPIGSIYINAGVLTNPATLFGFGTWVAFGAGRVMVGLNGADPLFDSLEETGGSKDATLVSHNHTGTTNGAGAHNHTVEADNYNLGDGLNFGGNTDFQTSVVTNTTSFVGDHAHSFTTSTQGSSATNANLQPYVTVAMWKRTA